MQIVVASILVIGLVITLNQFYGRMKAKSTDDNVNMLAQNTSIAQVFYTPTPQITDAPTLTPTNMNSSNINAPFKLNRDEIANLVSQGVINDSKYSVKKIIYGEKEFYTKDFPGNIFFKNKNSSKEELLFENKCLDFYIDHDVLYTLSEDQYLFKCFLDREKIDPYKMFDDDTKVSALFEDKNILYFYTPSGDLYKIEESSSTRKLAHDFGKLYKVINDWIYYFPIKNGEILETRPQYHGFPGKEIVLKCVRNNGEEEKIVYKDYNYQGWQADIKLICNDKDWIYYHTIALGSGGSGEGMMNPNFGLFGKMKIGSSEKTEYKEFRMYKPIEKDGYIYYISIYPWGSTLETERKETIKRINLKTFKHEPLLEVDNWVENRSFTIFKDWIYYIADDGFAERVKLDGSDKRRIDAGFPTQDGSFPIQFIPGYINDNGMVKKVLATAYKEEKLGSDQGIQYSTRIRIFDEGMKDVFPGKIMNIPEIIDLERIEAITLHGNNLYWKLGDEYFGYNIE